MKVVVGLGNPGTRYEATKHNVGFWVIDELSRRMSAPCQKLKFKAEIGEGRIGNEKVLLCKPQTFMNLSGESVREVVDYYSDIDAEHDVILVYDDMDFAPGQLRLREKGSAGGHNGVKSVIAHLGGQVFPRLRIGIGRPVQEQTVIDHVLSRFTKNTEPLVRNVVPMAAEAIQYAIEHSFAQAMNKYNTATP